MLNVLKISMKTNPFYSIWVYSVMAMYCNKERIVFESVRSRADDSQMDLMVVDLKTKRNTR